jgi:hypothetical protein
MPSQGGQAQSDDEEEEEEKEGGDDETESEWDVDLLPFWCLLPKGEWYLGVIIIISLFMSYQTLSLDFGHVRTMYGVMIGDCWSLIF